MQEAVRSRPAYADAYTGMGISLKELKRREEAEACFQQVVRLRPGCALSLGNLAGVPAGPCLALGKHRNGTASRDGHRKQLDALKRNCCRVDKDYSCNVAGIPRV